MWTILLRKFFYMCLSVLCVLTFTFILMKTIPGDPFQQEQALPTEIYQALRSYYGLNDSIPTQYFRYLSQLLTGDFGPSLIYKGQSISHIIWEGFPISALLGLIALTVAIPLGVIMGMVAAAKQNKWQDSSIAILSIIGISVPSFVLATGLQYSLAIKLGYFPIARLDSFFHLILPGLSLAALPTAFISRMTRTKMVEEMKQGYVMTARAKGLTESQIVFYHVFRNVFTPILSYLGPLTASILTGSFIVEKIYAIPGLGYWFVMSVSNRDYPFIMGITVFYCVILLFTSFFVDWISLILDPRMAYSAKNPRKNL